VVLRQAKKAMRLAEHAQLLDELQQAHDQYCRELIVTSDAVEGLKAFLEKRQPSWTQQ